VAVDDDSSRSGSIELEYEEAERRSIGKASRKSIISQNK